MYEKERKKSGARNQDGTKGSRSKLQKSPEAFWKKAGRKTRGDKRKQLLGGKMGDVTTYKQGDHATTTCLRHPVSRRQLSSAPSGARAGET